jgi:two-component system nitrate/nitrite response regulator NarL
MLARRLRDSGYTSVEVESAPEAVAAAARSRPDLSLIDLGMPGGGLNAVRAIYAADPTAKIVVLTGSTDEADVFRAVRAGAIGYLVKGIDDGAIIAGVDASIRGEPALPQRLLMLLLKGTPTAQPTEVELPSGATARLTPREAQVLTSLRQGLRTREIADRLGLSPITVRRHISRLLQKLDAPTRQAAVEALDAGGEAAGT